MSDLQPGAMLTDFVMLRKEAFSPELCEALITEFEAQSTAHTHARGEDTPLFTMMDLTAKSKESADCNRLHSQAVKALQDVVDLYRSSIAFDTLPEDMPWENIRLKRYLPDTGEQFPMHVDVQDLPSSKRALAFFCYLNDVEEGGETTFPVLGISIKPERGSVLVFPPLWLYPHSGEPVVSGAKYLCHSYLHYT